MSVTAESIKVPCPAVKASLKAILDPDSKHWSEAETMGIPLEPTPLDQQPSVYVRTAWKDRRRSDIREVRVSALSGTDALAVRLEWTVPRPQRRISDINVYADACAVLFPMDGKNFEHDTMGSEAHPVQAWHWRAGTEQAFEVTATGLGTAQRSSTPKVEVSSRWDDGCWQVILARPFDAEGAKLAPGKKVPVAFAVWSGVIGERAGLKAYTPMAHQLAIGS